MTPHAIVKAVALRNRIDEQPELFNAKNLADVIAALTSPNKDEREQAKIYIRRAIENKVREPFDQ